MKNKEIEFLKFLCSMTQKELAEYINNWLVLSGVFEDEEIIYLEDGFIYAKGDIPVCLVAHLDTVHKTLPTKIYHDQDEQILWAKEGIGGDDRCGVFAILKILKDGQRPHVLFTFDEETGALGALCAADELKPELNFMIEVDRRGEKDCVFYDCENPEFTEFIESFGFSSAWGSFSDISYLAPVWGCAAVNLSAGYENEHSLIETINYSWLFKNIIKIKNILDNADTSFKFMQSKNSYDYYSFYSRSYSNRKSKSIFDKNNYERCDACESYVLESEFDQENLLCRKCCNIFGIETSTDRNRSWNDEFPREVSEVECPCCKNWVSEDIYDEDSNMCMYCLIETEYDE